MQKLLINVYVKDMMNYILMTTGFGKCLLSGTIWRLKVVNRQLKLTRSNDFYDFYFYYFSTVWKSKSLYFFYFFQKYIFLKKLNETDTSLYFETVEKVTVSLPTKCLINHTSG